MTTLAEIEKAADALPIKQQQALLDHISLNLAHHRVELRRSERWPIPPPDVPIEELRRIHAIIEAEFPQAGPDGS
jgi:hypothetical protein